MQTKVPTVRIITNGPAVLDLTESERGSLEEAFQEAVGYRVDLSSSPYDHQLKAVIVEVEGGTV
jgi:hypothetical protein